MDLHMHIDGGPPSHDEHAPESLFRAIRVPVAELLLDPGDELSLADDPEVAGEAAFMRAFVPMRSFERLRASGLQALMSHIARQPAMIDERILVRRLADDEHAYVVVDGSRHVAALRELAEHGEWNGAELSDAVVERINGCPVTVVNPAADPALVLALLADANEPGIDPWLLGQRNHLLRQLAAEGVHHNIGILADAVAGDLQTLRRYHAFRALQQMMQHEPVAVHVAVALYPLFHAAVGRAVIRAWLDWDDTLCCCMDDVALERFYRLLKPSVRADGTTKPACLRTVDDVVHLCDVLAEPSARQVLLDDGGTLEAAIEVINSGAFHVWSTHVEQAFESMKWDRRRFRSR